MARYRIREHGLLRILAEGEHESAVAMLVHFVESHPVIVHQRYGAVGHLRFRIVKYDAKFRRIHQAVPDVYRSLDQIDVLPSECGDLRSSAPGMEHEAVQRSPERSLHLKAFLEAEYIVLAHGFPVGDLHPRSDAPSY